MVLFILKIFYHATKLNSDKFKSIFYSKSNKSMILTPNATAILFKTAIETLSLPIITDRKASLPTPVSLAHILVNANMLNQKY